MPDRKFRSLEDLDKAKEEIIDKIKESKNTVEEEVSDAISKLNNTLDSASGSLNTSINVFKYKVKEAKSAFNNIYFMIIIILLYLISMIGKYYVSESPVPSNSSVSIYSSIQKISLLIPFIAIVFISYFAVKAYRITSSIDNTDKLSTEIKNIDKNKFKDPKVPNSPQNAEVEKSSFDEKKVLLGSLITTLGRSIIPVKNIYEEATLLAKYQRIVKDFELCLVFYDVVKNNSFFESLRKYPPAEVQIFNDEKSWEDIIAQKISSRLDAQVLGQKLTLSENLILLLYYEHKGE